MSDRQIDASKANTWGTNAQTPETTQSSLETQPFEKAASETGGLGQRTCPARTSASHSPCVKFNDRSRAVQGPA